MATKEFNPFLFYSSELQGLLNKASHQKNPSLWLFQNNARTSYFMLEGLVRIHDEAFDEKLFSKWRKKFKKMEDIFGQIDYYLWLENEFKPNKKITRDVVAYCSEKNKKLIEKADGILLGKGWFEDKLAGFENKLAKYEVVYNEEYLDALKTAIIDEIEDIHIFAQKIDYSFTKFEEEVHNLRRKLRWLSIYGQAFKGLIQLKKAGKKGKYLNNYFTKEIINSPYNKLSAKPKNTAILEYDHDSFFALSWMISELGKCKDNGLRIVALADIIFKTQDITYHQAKLKAIQALGLKENAEEQMLKEVSEKVRCFILKDKILDTLIAK